ncbi:MAG TPA: TonB-dependent receptor [Vicinamibacterales bacterium]
MVGITAGLASAQSFQGGMRGAVKDTQGIVPGVTVTLTNEANGVTRDTVSNASGEYSFPALDPSSYTIKATVQGFKTFERRGIRIGTQQFITLDIALEVGTVEESITVTADAPLIETSNASHAEVIDAKTIETLPSIGRNVFLMAVTVPTVQSSGDTHWNRMQDQTGASAISLGGGGVRSNNYLLDGFPVTDLQNRSATNPSGEMVEDVRVQVHTYDAEMGRTGGGVLNTTAKSGSNTFRGSAFYQGRPNALIGPLFFNQIRNIENSPQFWRSFGGGFGGPVLQNKTFFWAAGEGYRDGLSQNSVMTVPTQAMRNGDFSEWRDAQGRQIPIYDPLTTDANGNRQAFPGNIIPANRISSWAREYLKAIPLPTSVLATGLGSLPAQDVINDAAQQGSFKLDHHFNDRISLSGVYLYQNSSEPDRNFFPDAPYAYPSYQLDRAVNVFVLNNTYIVNPTTVATLRFGMNTFEDDNSLPYDFDPATLGFAPSFVAAMPVKKFPSVTTTGFQGTGFTGVNNRNYYTYGGNGTITRLMGGHSLKVGADYRILGVKAENFGQSSGSFTFNGQFTAANPTTNVRNAIGDLLLGVPSAGTFTQNSFVNNFVHYYSGYLQDDWRVNDKLTLNYGVRLEHETGLGEADNKLVVGFDKTAVSPLAVTIPADPVAGTPARQVMGGLIYAGENGANTTTGNPPALKFSPRVGVAYSMSDKTVIRGGYGLFWAPWAYGANNSVGYSATTNMAQPNNIPAIGIADPFPSGLIPISGNSRGLLSGTSADISFVDPNKTAPYVQQYSIDVQRQLVGNLSASVAYIGSTGRRLTTAGNVNINQVDPKYLPLGAALTQTVPNPFFGNPNAGTFASRATIERNQLLRPFPQFLNVNQAETNLGKSQYHAGVISLRKRMTWWSGSFSYTYSRLWDNQFGQGNYYTSAPGLLNAYTFIEDSPYFNPDAEYGRSLIDSPHKLAMTPTVQLPFGSGRRFFNESKVANAILGNWTIAAVIQMQSGFPIGVSQNTNNTNLLGANQRPNIVPGVEFVLPGSITDRLRENPNDDRYLNEAAFVAAATGTFGNSPRILPGVYSPWRNSTDLAINKDIPMGSGRRAGLRLEIINLFDNPWYAAMTSVAYGNTNFSKVESQGNYSRTMQITARFSF